MESHDEQAGEHLWNQIEKLKQARLSDEHIASDGSGDLSSVVASIDRVMRKEISLSDGRPAARGRLQAAIEADIAKQKEHRKSRFRLPLFWLDFRRHQRFVFTSLILVLALSALAYEAWNEYQKAYCHTVITSPTKQ